MLTRQMRQVMSDVARSKDVLLSRAETRVAWLQRTKSAACCNRAVTSVLKAISILDLLPNFFFSGRRQGLMGRSKLPRCDFANA